MLVFFLPYEHTPSFLYKTPHGIHINLTAAAAAVGPMGVEWGQERAAVGARPLGWEAPRSLLSDASPPSPGSWEAV